ncbi:MAG: LPXTG cell wall anchor domain-containing protein [Promicromonosporaceae bacterium]|nr:LPXTG cell wall anchor domain-containing protein [Promicromonosporaceae bacterium]
MASAAVASAALLAAGLGLAGPAAADPSPDPSASQQTTTDTPAVTPSPDASEPGYQPSTPPSIDVTVLEPVCDGNVPYLQYAVDPHGTPNNTVTITWENPSGPSVVMPNLPLSGRVLWPGATVDAQGKPTGWPGWVKQADGTWVEGGPYQWVRPSVTVKFKVNPEATKTVTYPPSKPSCSANPPVGHNPTIKVDTLTPVCLEGVTYLQYGVSVTGTPNKTVTLTWHNPTGGPDFVQSGEPLKGRVLWPGAYPKRFVNLPASQGWHLVNNMWENTRDFGWAVGTVDVTFQVNPQVTVPVTYPQDTSGCVRTNGIDGVLPRTGAETAQLVAVAVVLVGLGAGIVLLTRRRKAKA